MDLKQITLSIVCPFYNEEDVVSLFFDRIMGILSQIDLKFEFVCVNDGSSDNTLNKLIIAKKKYPEIRIFNLSRNFGKEAALTAGLDHTLGDAVVIIDADLQDPPELIKDFITYWKQGYDVVLAKRGDRTSDTFIKRTTANLFYKFVNLISQNNIPENVGDFRLISRKVVRAIQNLPENQRFMKGLFAWVGFKTVVIEYSRESRKAGETSFNGWKLWNLAIEGITSFSTAPLKFWLYVGFLISMAAFLYGSFIVIRTFVYGVDVPGYASLLTTVLFLGGVQLIGIGVLGEYLGRIYMESKRRPTYIVDEEF